MYFYVFYQLFIALGVGFFDLSEAVSVDRGWAGIGQYTTLANPCQMLTVMGAIANGGSAPNPKLLMSDNSFSIQTKELKYMSSQTAQTIAGMLRKNVINQYGEWRFPGLEFCGKTGTAEVAQFRVSSLSVTTTFFSFWGYMVMPEASTDRGCLLSVMHSITLMAVSRPSPVVA